MAISHSTPIELFKNKPGIKLTEGYLLISISDCSNCIRKIRMKELCTVVTLWDKDDKTVLIECPYIIRRHYFVGRPCSCGIQIAFLKSKNGWQPVEVNRLSEAEQTRIKHKLDVEFSPVNHISHFATCVNSSNFKNRRTLNESDKKSNQR
jgi:hypothetical protein